MSTITTLVIGGSARRYATAMVATIIDIAISVPISSPTRSSEA